ncbi:hypothetical protein J6590_001862 [Homalodisca vitripennis]|nr:hypothetical protein J6590_001862 [Homalodisca vitripennis]
MTNVTSGDRKEGLNGTKTVITDRKGNWFTDGMPLDRTSFRPVSVSVRRRCSYLLFREWTTGKLKAGNGVIKDLQITCLFSACICLFIFRIRVKNRTPIDYQGTRGAKSQFCSVSQVRHKVDAIEIYSGGRDLNTRDSAGSRRRGTIRPMSTVACYSPRSLFGSSAERPTLTSDYWFSLLASNQNHPRKLSVLANTRGRGRATTTRDVRNAEGNLRYAVLDVCDVRRFPRHPLAREGEGGHPLIAFSRPLSASDGVGAVSQVSPSPSDDCRLYHLSHTESRSAQFGSLQ